MKYIKTFEKLNRIERSFKIGDMLIWNHLDDSSTHLMSIKLARNINFGDICEVMNVKYKNGDPYIKAKNIKTNKFINKIVDGNGRFMNNYDGNWFEEFYFIPKEAFQWTIFTAVRSNNINKTKELIKTYSDLNIKDNNGNTPLFYAARNNNLFIAKSLIENGADLNAEIRNYDNDLIYIIDLFDEDNKDFISTLYPEEYDKYLTNKCADKYNM